MGDAGEALQVVKGRLVPADSARVEPLYSASRVLGGPLFDAELALSEARARLAEAERARDELLAAAAAEARRTEAEAAERAAALLEQARDEGMRAGRRSLELLLQGMAEERERARRDATAELAGLALRFARAVLNVEFSVRPERIAEVAGEVLERAREHAQLHVRVHPDLAPHVRGALDGIAGRVPPGSDLAVVEDPSLEPGAVRVETEEGDYLGGAQAQLARIEEELARRAPRPRRSP